MPGKIFISYWRDDDPNGAARIRDALTARFGRSSVFIDVDDLLAGLRFDEELAKALTACDVFLAIIGARWMDLLNAKASIGDRDYVREEIAEALRRKIVVIPVRVGRDGQLPRLPREGELPPEIRDLVRYQKHDVTYEHFGRDASALVDAITAVRRRVRPKTAHARWGWIGATVASVLAIGWVGTQIAMPVWWPFGGDATPVLSKDDPAVAATTKGEATGAKPIPPFVPAQKSSNPAEVWAELKDSTDIPASEAFSQALQRDPGVTRRIEEGKRAQLSAVRSTPASKCDGVEITVAQSEQRCFKPGAGKAEHFKDCPSCPEMVVIPAGTFTMGSPASEPARSSYEAQVRVTISATFAVGRYAVMFDEWDACVADGGCNDRPDDQRWGRGRRPVINVNWDNAKSYAAWLSLKTGKSYRLLAEAEREYVTRAGTTTPFWWGSSITPEQANYDGYYTYGGGSKGEYRQRTVPVDSFEANPWGLYNVHGNVWEWTEDCWNESNTGNPGDGSARTTGDCTRRVVRGGSWVGDPHLLRSAYRSRTATVRRYVDWGFRVARTLNP
jgi:formylglycine-generating enzyme required for sulfatase activity